MAVTPTSKRSAHGNTLQASGVELSGGRSAPGPVQRKGIARRRVLWQRSIPGDDLRRADEIKPGSSQRRHMQCLADVAGIVRSLGVGVGERSANREVQQRGASQHRQRTAHNGSPENSFLPVHTV